MREPAPTTIDLSTKFCDAALSNLSDNELFDLQWVFHKNLEITGADALNKLIDGLTGHAVGLYSSDRGITPILESLKLQEDFVEQSGNILSDRKLETRATNHRNIQEDQARILYYLAKYMDRQDNKPSRYAREVEYTSLQLRATMGLLDKTHDKTIKAEDYEPILNYCEDRISKPGNLKTVLLVLNLMQDHHPKFKEAIDHKKSIYRYPHVHIALQNLNLLKNTKPDERLDKIVAHHPRTHYLLDKFNLMPKNFRSRFDNATTNEMMTEDALGNNWFTDNNLNEIEQKLKPVAVALWGSPTHQHTLTDNPENHKEVIQVLNKLGLIPPNHELFKLNEESTLGKLTIPATTQTEQPTSLLQRILPR